MEKQSQKFTVKRIGKANPYADYRDRCVYACETMRSITAPEHEQVIELEGMLLD